MAAVHWQIWALSAYQTCRTLDRFSVGRQLAMGNDGNGPHASNLAIPSDINATLVLSGFTVYDLVRKRMKGRSWFGEEAKTRAWLRSGSGSESD